MPSPVWAGSAARPATTSSSRSLQSPEALMWRPALTARIERAAEQPMRLVAVGARRASAERYRERHEPNVRPGAGEGPEPAMPQRGHPHGPGGRPAPITIGYGVPVAARVPASRAVSGPADEPGVVFQGDRLRPSNSSRSHGGITAEAASWVLTRRPDAGAVSRTSPGRAWLRGRVASR